MRVMNRRLNFFNVDGEGGSPAVDARGANGAVMAVDDPLARGSARARAHAPSTSAPDRRGKSARTHAAATSGGHADARVANLEHRVAARFRQRDRHDPAPRREFERVVEQVEQQPLEPFGIPLDGRRRVAARTPASGPAPAPPARAVRRLIRPDRREIHARARQRDLSRFGARQREELIDQPLELVELFELTGRGGALVLAARRGFIAASSISPRSAAIGVRSSCASAVLNWRISPTASSTRASVSLNAMRHVVELVVRAADRQPLPQVAGVDDPRRVRRSA